MKVRPQMQCMEAFVGYFERASTHSFSEGVKMLGDCISLMQKDTKVPHSNVETTIKSVFSDNLKKDYVECEKAYYALAFLKEKEGDKSVHAYSDLR